MKKIIIGFGTGRSGTVTLSRMLSQCNNVDVSHEYRDRGIDHRLPWEFDKSMIDNRLQHLQSFNSNIVGDVAHYYLNYIPYIKQVMGNNVKFIYLHRDTMETVESFMKKSGNFCHWLSPEHPDFTNNRYKAIEWDKTFPTYDNAVNKKSAIKQYVESYHIIANLYSSDSNNCLKVNIKDLNLTEKKEEIFDFLDIPKIDRVYENVWENQNV